MATSAPTGDLLATIVASTRHVVESRQAREPIDVLARRAEARGRSTRSLLSALQRVDRVNVIAECKRRSPSRGVLRADYDPAAIAAGYAAAGAAAVSVLTEPTFFDGSIVHLEAVRAAVDLPVLRKDFIVSDYQLLEAKAAGADAVLLIVASLQRAELVQLLASAERLGLDALVEVHTALELAQAVDAGSRLVGVNNRDLRTLQVDVHASEALIDLVPKHVAAISESGLRTSQDVARLRGLGYRGFLVGERFMTAADPGAELRELLEDCKTAKDMKDTKDTKKERHDA